MVSCADFHDYRSFYANSGESGIGTEESSSVKSTPNGSNKHAIDSSSRQSPSSPPPSSTQHAEDSDNSQVKPEHCNGTVPTAAAESLTNENNNADNEEVTPCDTPVPNGDISMEGDTPEDDLNYSTMNHQQEMASVTTAGDANSSEHNNQPFDLHSQASSGEWVACS